MEPLFDFTEAMQAAWRPTPKLPIDQWLKKNVRLERGHIVGALDIENSPWIRDPLLQLQDHTVREIICACSVQSAKTLFAEATMLYLIAEEGGDMGLYLQTDELADEFLDTRFKHRILGCQPVRDLLIHGTRSIQKRTVNFAHMTQFVLGSGNIHNVQSKALRYVFGDEAAYWLPGRMDEAVKRTTSFSGRNSKRIFISTPMNNKGEFYRRFSDGTMAEWHVRCPECNEAQKMDFRNLRWGDAGKQLPDGRYDIAAIKKAVRYVCPHCSAELIDNPITRNKIARSGFYVDTNPNADPAFKSYHWNSLTVPWVEWGDVAAEFVKAEAARKNGDFTPLMEFVRKRLGEFWDDRSTMTEDVTLADGLKMLEAWDDEFRRYMTVDVQKDWFRIVVRSWAQDGRSRLYWAGEAHTWSEIVELQEKHAVRPYHTFVDCGFERYTNEVYRNCAANGWIALKGDKSRGWIFRSVDPHTKQTTMIRRPYSQKEKVDSGVGLKRTGGLAQRQADLCNRILWSSDYIKQILVRLRAGQGAEWLVPVDAPKFYREEISNEVYVTQEDKMSGRVKGFFKKTGPNHSYDAEAMQIVAACIEKLLGPAEVEVAQSVDTSGVSDAQS